MAVDELATKALESDAADTSLIAGDTPAQTGPTMGRKANIRQEMTTLGEIDTYITKPSDYPHSPSKLLLFLTNGAGLHSINNQLQADMYAKEGYLVVMPDLFGGDAAPNSSTTTTDALKGAESSFLDQFKLRAAETAKSFLLDMWLARQTPEKVMPILYKVIEAAKDDFADAVANGGGIYTVGYCFGGKYVLRLAGEHPETVMWGRAVKDEEAGAVRTGPIVKTGALAHGTLVTPEDLTALKAPVYMACIEEDPLFSDEIREDGRKFLEENKIEHKMEMFSGVPHGFAVLGQYEDPKIGQAQKKAFTNMLAWLNAH